MVDRLCGELAALAAASGLFRYHETMALFTVTVVHAALAATANAAGYGAARLANHDGGAVEEGPSSAQAALPNDASFAEFAAAHPALLDPRLYRNYYSDRLMCNDLNATHTFALPDIQQLPSLVA